MDCTWGKIRQTGGPNNEEQMAERSRQRAPSLGRWDIDTVEEVKKASWHELKAKPHKLWANYVDPYINDGTSFS